MSGDETHELTPPADMPSPGRCPKWLTWGMFVAPIRVILALSEGVLFIRPQGRSTPREARKWPQ
jgi:hypothetical protein